MEEGLPVAYPLLQGGVPVTARGGTGVGTVHHVLAAPAQDIFHGLVISTLRLGRRFVPPEDIASLHERGVELRLTVAEVAELPSPDGRAIHDEDPAGTSWEQWAQRLTAGGARLPR